MTTAIDEEKWEPTTPPWIVCAANRYGDTIIAGARHHDSIMRGTVRAIGGGDWRKGWDILLGDDWKERGSNEEQGFIDQWGRFYTREEASYVAAQNGQCRPELMGCGICSEDLY